MTNQEIFDKVSKHLLEQAMPAFDPITNGCRYRGANGTKCAVGCLIKDEFYSPDLENNRVGHPRVTRAVGASLNEVITAETEALLSALQRVHDRATSTVHRNRYRNRAGNLSPTKIKAAWKEDLQEVAQQHGLEMNS